MCGIRRVPKQDRAIQLRPTTGETERPTSFTRLSDKHMHHVGDGMDQRQFNRIIVSSPQLGSLPSQAPNIILQCAESAVEDGG
jgi:hypothetical protein